jgi:hypothetical protein
MSLWYLGAEYANTRNARSSVNNSDLNRAPLNNAPVPEQPKMQGALAALGKYIPAETTTIFIACLGLIAIAKKDPNFAANLPQVISDGWAFYVGCAILTPLFVYLAARTAWRQGGQQAGSFAMPIWRIGAATLAFLVWGLAVPGFLGDVIIIFLASLGAIVISPLLVSIEQAYGLN